MRRNWKAVLVVLLVIAIALFLGWKQEARIDKMEKLEADRQLKQQEELQKQKVQQEIDKAKASLAEENAQLKKQLDTKPATVVRTVVKEVPVIKEIVKLVPIPAKKAAEKPTSTTQTPPAPVSNTDAAPSITVNGVKVGAGSGRWVLSDTTGTTTEKLYSFHIPSGYVLIIECNVLDGVPNGHLVAYPAQSTDLVIRVKNGFVGIAKDTDAKDLFTERHDILRSNNWDHGIVKPLSSWNWAHTN